MAALVQSFPQQTSTGALLPPGPVSAAGAFTVVPSMPSHPQHAPRSVSSSGQRTMYGGPVVGGYVGYRAPVSVTPITPYGATTTTTTTTAMRTGGNVMPSQSTPHLRPENRTFSAPGISLARPGHDPAVENAGLSSSQTPVLMPPPELASRSRPLTTKDDSSIATGLRQAGSGNRPLSNLNLASSPTFPAPTAAMGPARPSPERYRRGLRRPEPTNGTAGTPPATAERPSAAQLYDLAAQSINVVSIPPPPHPTGSAAPLQRARSSSALTLHERPAQPRTRSVDDLQLYGPRQSEPAKRYRRRSTSGLDMPEFGPRPQSLVGGDARQAELNMHGTTFAAGREPGRRSPTIQARPDLGHRRQGSSDSVHSARSNQSRPPSREPVLSPLTPLTSNPVTGRPSTEPSHEAHVVHRGAADAHRRLANPSPLSRPVVMTSESPSPQQATVARGVTAATPGTSDSLAAQHLAEVSEKDAKKGVKSRLRRAFSFGSAAELRRASAENSAHHASAERARLRKERYHDEQEARQAAIAQKQEAGGIGEGIYSGQGTFFTGSSDNLSVSSTASSASIMIRKMGKGMKKSTRSLVGLFRPRSIVGVPAADAAVPGASEAQVSMVTAEAEPQKVNVNADPHDHAGGGTGFPKLERNSLDASRAAAADSDKASSVNSEVPDLARSRRSIVGGDLERAEVLAAVKKGILKRRGADSATSSPVTRPVDAKIPEFNLPVVPHVFDSPHSSAPSTPVEENSPAMGHRRTDSVRIEGEDYFASLPRRMTTESKSNPDTPASIAKYTVTFSPRIQFHDTWPSGEYDRRGDIATCNRLTPILAQQIKEELNTFKMEMEVHEQSKVYTHFF